MKKKILIIDDEADILSILRARLEANGYETIIALNGQKGLELLAEEKPDLVVIDIMMPVMDGFTFIQETKKIKSAKNTPVIVLTAKEMMDDLFKKEGVKDYIIKPFQAEQLLATIRKYI